MTALRLLFLLLACCATGRAVAQVTVVSPRPEAVTVTVYRQGVAQITETRQVELPTGPVNLVFEGVVDTMLPQSAVMNGAGRAVTETNFDFDQLSTASLLERSVGKEVVIVRTNRRTGAIVRQAATIVSASGEEGVVILTVEGSEALKCSGLPERLEFSGIPDGLRTTPTLSVLVGAGTAGKRTLVISYLVHGITWSADYVARLNTKGSRMDFTGWATLTNGTSVSFDHAQIQLVSGELELQYGNGGSRPAYSRPDPRPGEEGYEDDTEELTDPEPRLPLGKCETLPPPVISNLAQAEDSATMYGSFASQELNEVSITGTRITPVSLGDYKLYRLPEPTDLKSRQTKQVLFLSKPRVAVERFYQLESRDFASDDDDDRYMQVGAKVGLKWHNNKAAGLGEPLPGGQVRVFERFTGHEVFAGEARMSDKPLDLDVEIFYRYQLGISAERSRDPSPDDLDDSRQLSIKVKHRIFNSKTKPVTVVVQFLPGYWRLGTPRVKRSSLPPISTEGDPAWRIRIPAGSERVLNYEIEADNLDYDAD